MFRMMEYENGYEVKNFKEFYRISETKEKFKQRINPGRYISFSPARIMSVISPHLIKAIVNHYSNKRKKLSEVHVNASK